MKGRTTFIIAHRIQSVMNADLIVVLDKGEVVQIGQHEELLEQPGIYRQIFDIQTRIESELEAEISGSQGLRAASYVEAYETASAD
jgi:ATP-binding cassette subfamily B protein